jgi:hypothetical protein
MGDSSVTGCEPFCSAKKIKDHCPLCRCKKCDFCRTASGESVVKACVRCSWSSNRSPGARGYCECGSLPDCYQIATRLRPDCCQTAARLSPECSIPSSALPLRELGLPLCLAGATHRIGFVNRRLRGLLPSHPRHQPLPYLPVQGVLFLRKWEPRAAATATQFTVRVDRQERVVVRWADRPSAHEGVGSWQLGPSSL